MSSKNLSIQKLSFFISLTLSLIVLVICIIYNLSFALTALLFLAVFVFNFIILYFSLKNFIYRNIRLIYKLISDTRATKKEEYLYNQITPNKTINEVTEEVKSWAIKKNKEIKNLKENEAFRREFLQNLAHELKTPLFTAHGYIQTLQNGAMEDEELAQQFLSKASKSLERLTALTSDIDDISKLESGKALLHNESFVIQGLFEEVIEELDFIIQERRAEVGFKVDASTHNTVFADKNKIRQVITNLIQNALKYSYTEPKIEIGVYKLDNEKIYVEISDNGVGIDQKHLPRLFERFYRVDKSRDRNIAGSGLGLSIVKHIIEAHGETVNVRSKVNIGTTFGFTLPKKKSLQT